MAALILFISFTVIVFLTGYTWRKVSEDTAEMDRQAVRVSLLSKL